MSERKKLVRQAWVIQLASTLLAAYLKFTYATMRWTVENEDLAHAVENNAGTGAIACFWHSRIALAPCLVRGLNEKKVVKALISLSADGELISLTVDKLGFPAIRGSRAIEKEEGRREAGGKEAFREMVRWVKGGDIIAITPDGPLGPAEEIGEGGPTLARVTGADVILAGLAAKPCVRLKTWDQSVLPLPFSRGMLVWDGLLHLGRGDDPVEAAQEWRTRLKTATDRAEALLQ